MKLTGEVPCDQACSVMGITYKSVQWAGVCLSSWERRLWRDHPGLPGHSKDPYPACGTQKPFL